MVWRRRAVLLANLPGTGGRATQRLELGLDKPEDSTGWALTDTRAAASWGIPIVAAGDYPPDFYVPSETALRAAFSHLGEPTNPAYRACTVAVAPVRLACLRRVDHSHTTGEQWPVTNHIVVALDIAQDRARGLEALEQWQPKGSCVRGETVVLVSGRGGSHPHHVSACSAWSQRRSARAWQPEADHAPRLASRSSRASAVSSK